MLLIEFVRFLAFLALAGASITVVKGWLIARGSDRAATVLGAIYN